MDRKAELGIALGAALVAACSVSQKAEVPATSESKPIVVDVEDRLRRQDAEHGLVYGRWWYIPCSPSSTSFEFYNLAGTQGEGPHEVSGGMHTLGQLNRLYINPDKPNGVYEQKELLKCYKYGIEVEVRDFRYRIFLID